MFFNIDKIIVWSGQCFCFARSFIYLLVQGALLRPGRVGGERALGHCHRVHHGRLGGGDHDPGVGGECPQQHQEHLLQTSRPGRDEGHQAQGH